MPCRRRGAVSFGLLLLLTPLYPAAAQLHQTAGGLRPGFLLTGRGDEGYAHARASRHHRRLAGPLAHIISAAHNGPRWPLVLFIIHACSPNPRWLSRRATGRPASVARYLTRRDQR